MEELYMYYDVLMDKLQHGILLENPVMMYHW